MDFGCGLNGTLCAQTLQTNGIMNSRMSDEGTSPLTPPLPLKSQVLATALLSGGV